MTNPMSCSEPHLGRRPGWTCAACGEPWPCARARRELLAEFDRFPSSLTVYMSCYLTEALEDLTVPGGTTPPDLWDRFIGWTRRHAMTSRA